MKNKELKLSDIESANIYLLSKDGRVCVSTTSNEAIISLLISTQKFIELDSDKVAKVKIEELK